MHFLNYLAQLAQGKPQSLNLILKIWRQISKEECEKVLRDLDPVGKPWVELQLELKPEDMLPSGADYDRLDVARLERIATMQAVHARFETDPGKMPPSQAPLVVPGRSTLQGQHAPRVDVDGQPEADYLYDDMDEANLNSTASVQGLMNSAVEVLRAARESGDLAEGDYLDLVGLFLCGDGNPVSKMIDIHEAHPQVYANIKVFAGGFHVLMNALRHGFRLISPTLKAEVAAYRKTPASQEYLCSGAQIRQAFDESPEWAAAWMVCILDAMRASSRYAGKDVGPRDVEEYMLARANACPLFAVRLAGWTTQCAMFAMDEATRDTVDKPRGDFEAHVAHRRLLTLVFAATNGTEYAKILAHEIMDMLTESPMSRAARKEWVWIQWLPNGRSRPADMVVEEAIRRLRYYVGPDGHGTVNRIMRWTRLHEEIHAARHGNDHATDRIVREAGSVCSTAAYASAHAAFKRLGLCGTGADPVNSPLCVPDLRAGKARGATRNVPPATLVGADGRPMDGRAVLWPTGAEARLKQYYGHRYFGEPSPGTHLFQNWPMMAGDLGELAYTAMYKLTCTSLRAIKGDGKKGEAKCGVTGVKIFGNAELRRMLEEMRDAACINGEGGGHEGCGAGAATAPPQCACPLCMVQGADSSRAKDQIVLLLGTPDDPVRIKSKGKPELAEKLVVIRVAAGVKEIDREPYTAAADLEELDLGAKDVVAALRHRFYANETAQQDTPCPWPKYTWNQGGAVAPVPAPGNAGPGNATPNNTATVAAAFSSYLPQ